ncbi:FAD-dependent monooxygenase [Chthonobacter albigriseus]|uniref:FAD-dependent monooxygenase n=1 Tax=Chthonobacter albigriseus TaxID=1683161 RepID=UPI0015EE5BD6|nr:FAD-dependent monooxygenase [Chthonobacter albigriseus]
MAETPPVVIVGAGIAGLTAALALARGGRRSVVLERADHLSEVGAGIQLSPNATRILIDLGLRPALEPLAVAPRELVIRDAAADRILAELPLGQGIETAYGAPYWVVHRGDLQGALLDAVRRDGRIDLALGCCIEGMVPTDDGVTVDAWIGSQRRHIVGDALIGADGVWSQTRVKLLGGKPARYSGRTAWRATIPAAQAGSVAIDRLTSTTGLWLGPSAHLVHYPVRAGRDLNIIAAVDDDWIDQRWDVLGDPADLVRAFTAWPAAVRDLLALPQAWRKWALCAVSEPRWTKGRVALIGDAAHAMLPFVAQGGAMAIEDAAVLATALARTDRSVEQRLKGWEAERRPRAMRVASSARDNASTYHLSGLPAKARNLVMQMLGPDRLLKRMDWIWGWKQAG